MLLDSGLDLQKTFEMFKPMGGKVSALTACKEWVDQYWGQPPKGLLLFGGTGTGKSHLANAAGIELIDARGIFVKFLPTVRIPRRDTDEVLRLADPDEVPVLVLDDLGAEKRTERALECLYILIDGRLRARAPTIVTTNWEPDELEGWLGDEYGPRIVGRLREMCTFVPVGGEDMRRCIKQ